MVFRKMRQAENLAYFSDLISGKIEMVFALSKGKIPLN